MILFAGIPSEPPLALAVDSARREGVAHVVLNQRHSAYEPLNLAFRGGRLDATVTVGGQSFPLGAFTGIYARPIEAAVLPEFCSGGRNGDIKAMQQMIAFSELLTDLLDIAPCIVVNRPLAMGSNLSKPYQAQLIVRSGLLVPETLVTSDPEEVRAFHCAHGRIIYKSVSSVRSIVREWTPADGPDLASVARLPTQFQALVTGVDIRVHVVGRDVFATEISSDAIDYRYAGRQDLTAALLPTTLPRPIAEICVSLTRALGLSMSGIDLRRTPDGAWYCFEVNPSPAYSYYQEHTGQPISDALVRLLRGPTETDAPMVQIVENRAEIAGELLGTAPDPDRPGYVRLSVRIDAARPVQGYPNLIAQSKGSTVTVTARSDSALATQEPGPVSFRARHTGPTGLFAE